MLVEQLDAGDIEALARHPGIPITQILLLDQFLCSSRLVDANGLSVHKGSP
jgi:hypothetical protein